jgi:hypothetical protein
MSLCSAATAGPHHLFANFLVLASPRHASCTISAFHFGRCVCVSTVE